MNWREKLVCLLVCFSVVAMPELAPAQNAGTPSSITHTAQPQDQPVKDIQKNQTPWWVWPAVIVGVVVVIILVAAASHSTGGGSGSGGGNPY